MKQALILIDIQNDYFPGGKCELVGIQETSLKSRDLLAFFRENKLPIFHIQHIEEEADAEFFAAGTSGVEINECVNPISGEEVIIKHAPNSFLNTDLKGKLTAAGINKVIISGHMSHMCIDASARAALDLGFECTVIEDSCTTYNLEFKDFEIPAAQAHAAFMVALEEAGCEVVDLETFLSNN